MIIRKTYPQACEKLAELLNQVTSHRNVVIIQREGEEDVAMVTASELRSLMETVYLLRSPVNAERLLSALDRSLKNEANLHVPKDFRRSVEHD